MTNDAKRQMTDHFRNMLITVVGSAFSAAGYHLEDATVQQNNGLFRFHKPLADDAAGRIEFQLLYLPSTEWSGNTASRFRVSLARTGADPLRRTLAALVVEDFDVPILPSADHWWMFANTDELGKTLAEAGHLAVGYGIPWLAGDLTAPNG